MTVEVSHRFDAPPETVFALLSDVERMAGLGPEHTAAHWTDEDRTTFVGTNVRGDRQWDVPCTVTERTPPRRFAWVTNDPSGPSASWSYDLTPEGDGAVVRERFAHGPGTSGLRTFVEAHPEKAETAIAHRAAELQSGMLATLEAAAALLS